MATRGQGGYDYYNPEQAAGNFPSSVARPNAAQRSGILNALAAALKGVEKQDAYRREDEVARNAAEATAANYASKNASDERIAQTQAKSAANTALLGQYQHLNPGARQAALTGMGIQAPPKTEQEMEMDDLANALNSKNYAYIKDKYKGVDIRQLMSALGMTSKDLDWDITLKDYERWKKEQHDEVVRSAKIKQIESQSAQKEEQARQKGLIRTDTAAGSLGKGAAALSKEALPALARTMFPGYGEVPVNLWKAGTELDYTKILPALAKAAGVVGKAAGEFGKGFQEGT